MGKKIKIIENVGNFYFISFISARKKKFRGDFRIIHHMMFTISQSTKDYQTSANPYCKFFTTETVEY